MFAQIPVAALSDHRLSLIDSRVLAALYSFASASNPVCWPSRAAISERCGYCPETISRAVTRLKRFGWIVRTVALRGCQRYILRGVTGSVTARGDGIGHTEQTKGTDHNSPLPPAPAPAPQAPEKPVAPMEKEDKGQVEGTTDKRLQNDRDALEVVLAMIAISGAQFSTKRTDPPMMAARRALYEGFSVEELKMIVAFVGATWSNPQYMVPSAVLRPDRLQERLAMAKARAPAGQRASCHKPFEREPEVKRADPGTVRGHLSKLKAALGGQALG